MINIMQKAYLTLITAVLLLGLTACVSINRTGTGVVTLEEEIELGEVTATSYLQHSGGPITNKNLRRLVSRVGNKLAAFSSRELPYEFTVVNSSDINAYAFPGGKIMVSRALLAELGSEAELAAVLAHEIAHADARHSINALERQQMAAESGLEGLLSVFGIQVSAAATLAEYSRSDESEADVLALDYMQQAGYSVAVVPKVFERLQAVEERMLAENPDAPVIEAWEASHPSFDQRIETVNLRIAGINQQRGRINARGYKKAVRGIVRHTKSYAQLEDAFEAFDELELRQARRLINRAIKSNSREAQLYVMRGLINLREDKYKSASRDFVKAAGLNKNWYLPAMMAGYAYSEREQYKTAEKWLQKSLAVHETVAATDMLTKARLAQ